MLFVLCFYEYTSNKATLEWNGMEKKDVQVEREGHQEDQYHQNKKEEDGQVNMENLHHCEDPTQNEEEEDGHEDE